MRRTMQVSLLVLAFSSKVDAIGEHLIGSVCQEERVRSAQHETCFFPGLRRKEDIKGTGYDL